MPDKSLTYTVKLDANSAQAQASQLRALFQQQLSSIQVNLLDPASLNSALSSTQAIRAQLDAAANSSQAAVLALQQANAGTLQTQFDQIARDAQQAAQSMQQAATAPPQRPQQPIGGGASGGGNGLGTLGNAVLGGVAGYFTVQGARQIIAQATSFAEFGTQVRRTSQSFEILSGSTAQAQANLNAIKEASGGTVTNLQAMDVADQAIALHLANTSQGLGEVTRAAREIALVSPTIKDMGEAMSQLGLFAANPQSFARADQLGLSASEVRNRMKELQAANAGLDDSQAKLQASMQLLDEKFGSLLNTEEARASGVEKLKVAFSDLWAEVAKGPAGIAVDKGFGAVGDVVEKLRASFGSTDPSALNGTLESLIRNAKEYQAIGFDKVPGFGSYIEKNISGFQDLQKALKAATDGVEAGIPSAENYRTEVENLIISAARFGALTEDDIAKLRQITAEYNVAAKAVTGYSGALDNPAVARGQYDTAIKARQDRLDKLVEPVDTLGNDLKGAGLDNFFQQLHDGLAASAEMTATENNHLATMRQQLVDIGRAVADSGGAITESQRNQVAAINQQIEALSRAASLNEKLKIGDKGGGGQDLDAIYTRLNAIVAQTRGQFDETANAARALGDAIAQSGSASAEQLGQIEQLAAQANQADFSRIAESLRELNSGSLDAVPGIDNLRDGLSNLYDVVASGQGLTAAQADELASLSAQADALGGSSSALAEIQAELGYTFLDSNTYASGLVEQIAYLEMLYGTGKIGADEFSGGMSVLTGALETQLVAAGKLTPELARLLTMLNAVNAAAGGPLGPAGPFFGGFPGGGGVNRNSAGYQEGQARARAAEERARAQADAKARADAIKEQEKAQKHAAGAAQNAFEDAAKGTQKAFEAVVDDMRSALQKVEGLFSPSKVTAEDMALSKAGLYTPKADELLRQVKSAAENPADQARFASQIAQAREALQKIGVAPAENIKAMAAQLEQAWSSSALFSNKDNLKLINADAVKLQLNLAAKAKEGQENIYEYFGATLDGVKEKFKAKDPTIVDAVAAELQGSQDKNLKALGKSLQDGIQGAVDKALSNLAAAEAGFAKGAGGGGGGGGGAVSVGAIPTSGGGGTWIDKVSENVGKTYQNFADLYMPQTVTPPKGTGGLYGPPAPAGLNTTGLQPTELMGKVKITAVELDPTVAGTGVAALVNKIAAQFDDPANRAVLAAKGPQMSGLIQAAFTELAVYQPMAGPLVNELVNQFNDPANKAVLAAKGPEMSSIIQSSFTELATYQPMAGPLVNEIKAQFDDPANKAVEAGIGLDISDGIQHGIKDLAVYQDMTINLVQALSTQFLNEQNVTNYKAIGTTIRDQIIQGVGSAEDIAKGVNADALPKETEGADGKTKRKSAFDFGQTVDQVNQSLSRSFGQSTDFMKGIGDSLASFIGFGMTDHDFSGTSAMVMGSLNASFTGDAARTQLQGIGSAISGAIFAGFQSSIAYQPWLSTIVQEVVSQALDSINTSVNDSLQTQAVGL